MSDSLIWTYLICHESPFQQLTRMKATPRCLCGDREMDAKRLWDAQMVAWLFKWSHWSVRCSKVSDMFGRGHTHNKAFGALQSPLQIRPLSFWGILSWTQKKKLEEISLFSESLWLSLSLCVCVCVTHQHTLFSFFPFHPLSPCLTPLPPSHWLSIGRTAARAGARARSLSHR